MFLFSLLLLAKSVLDFGTPGPGSSRAQSALSQRSNFARLQTGRSEKCGWDDAPCPKMPCRLLQAILNLGMKFPDSGR